MLIAHLAAEPASIFYILTGGVGLLFSRFRNSLHREKSSVAMLFCRKASREKLAQISLT